MSAGGAADDETAASRRRWTMVGVASLALLAALVTISPALRFAAAHGGTGTVFLEAKDAEFYVAQVRRAAEGTYGHANDLVWEWSQGPQRTPPWTYSLLGAVWKATGAPSPHWVVAWASAAAAAAHVVLFFAIARTLRLSRAASLAVAAAACLAPFLWSFHGTDLWLGRPGRVLTPFLPLWRPVNPSVSSLLVWGGVLALLRWLRRPAWPAWVVCAAIVASAWSAYPAAFVFLGAVVAAAAVVEMLGGRLRHAAAVAAIAVLAGAVNLASIREVTSRPPGASPDGATVSNMLSLPSRAPILTANLATALALALTWIVLNRRRRGDAPRRSVAIAMPLALTLLFNLQVVTGRLDQPFHYDWFWSVPVIWMLVALVAADLRARARAAARVLSSGGRMRTAQRLVAGAAVLAVVLCLGGTVTGGMLRALGVLRGDAMPDPWLRAGLAAAAAAATVWVLRSVAAHRWRRVTLAATAAAALLAVVEGARIQHVGYVQRHSFVADRAPLANALAKLREVTAPDDVVACPDDIAARWVPSYTGRRVLISAEVQFAAAVPSDDEFRRRRYVALALFGLPADELAAGLGDGGRWHGPIFKWRTFGPPTGNLAILSNGVHAAPLEPGDAERAAAAYREAAATPRRELLSRFRVDWVLWRGGPDTVEFRDPGEGDGLELVHEAAGVRIYRVAD